MCSTAVPKMEKPFCEFSASCGSLSNLPNTSSPRNALNESYTVSKDYNEDKNLTVIYEENSECGNDSNGIDLESFASITDLSECKNIPFVDQGTMQISVLPEYKKEIYDIGEYDSDESMGLLPDLLEDLTYDSFIFCKDDLNKDLNTIVNDSDIYLGNFNDCLNHDLKCSSKEFVISPVCNKTNISCIQTESPVYCNQSMPVYASTPKHEISYSYAIDEEIASPQNMPDCHLNKISQDYNEKENDYLNKTTVIETGLNSPILNIPISTCLDSDENINSQQNILNTTCNMTKPMDIGEILLNKTFESLDVLVDKCVLSPIASNTEQYQISKPNILNKTFEHHYSAEFDPDLGKENILNLTCHIVKESDIIGTVSREFSESPKDSTRDVLNTTVSYPYVHDESPLIYSLSENKSDINIDQNNFQAKTGDILNSTYEKIDESVNYDANSEKLKCITNFGEKKPLQPGIKIISKKRVLSFPAKKGALENIEFKNKGIQFSRNANMRRSVGCFGETNVTETDSIKRTRKSLLSSSTCPVSKVPEIKENLSFAKSLLPKHAANIEDKSSLINRKKVVNMNPSYLNKTIKCMPLKLSDNKSRDIKVVSKIKPKGSQESLLNATINLHPTSGVDKTVECSSKFPKYKSKDIKSLSKDNLKESQESLLNTTISLTPPITDVSKTVIKKPRNSMLISYTKESSLNNCSSPPITDATKTVIKKPRNSMLIRDTKESCLNPCKLPFGKDIKSSIPSFLKRVSMTASQALTQDSNETKTSALSNKMGLKDTISVEEKMMSRLPQKPLSQKTKFQSDPQSSSMKPSSNLAKPQSITSIRPSTTSMKSLFTLSKKSSNKESEFAGKDMLNDDLPCQKSKEQSTKSIELPTTSRKSLSTLSKKCSNKGSELAGKAILQDAVPCQKSKEQSTEMVKKFTRSSKIPSVSHLPRPEKTSLLISKRTGASICKTSHLDSR